MGLFGLPDTVFVRQKDILRCLGISQWDLDKVVRAGLVHRVKWRKKQRGRYVTKEVIRVFTKGVPNDVLEKE